MRRETWIRIFFLTVSPLFFVACERRSLEDFYAETARVPVKIDWSRSGMNISGLREDIHRVSIRFFPKDGSPAFDRYLERNVVEDEIEVPVGSYSVVVFNESIHDIFWKDAVYFTDVENYSGFAAHVVADDPLRHSFYSPLPGENLFVEPPKLASWSLDNFEVTDDMLMMSRYPGKGGRVSAETEKMLNELTHIVMRPLTHHVHVTASIENICSAYRLQGAVRGFSHTVYMASAQTVQMPATHVFLLNGRQWSDHTELHGTVERSFLSFGRLPQASDYYLHLDVVLITGELYVPGQALLYDVTEQVFSSTDNGTDIHIAVALSLPYIEDGIHVGDWSDEEITIR